MERGGNLILIKKIVASNFYYASKNVTTPLKSRVDVWAITGIAAFNIEGTVIDGYFFMPRDRPNMLLKLSTTRLTELRFR